MAALLALLLAPPAAAQVGPPLRLLPDERAAPSAPPAATFAPVPVAAPQAAEPAPDDPGAVRIDKLEAFDPSAVGTLHPEQGGFPLDLWRGSRREAVEPLISRLEPSRSAALRDLARRLLLSPARVPEGPGGEPTLLARRVDRLVALGALDEAVDLAETASAGARDRLLEQRLRDALWLTGDTDKACARVQADSVQDVAWRKANAACRALAGEHAMAGLAAGLLREAGIEDPDFYALLAALGGDGEPQVTRPEELAPLHLALLRAAGAPPPASALNGASPGLSRAIAGLSAVPDPLRLSAAEAAANAGALDPAQLAAAYRRVSFPAADLGTAPSLAETLPDARANAALFQAAEAAMEPAAKAEILRLAWRRGQAGDLTAAVLAGVHASGFGSLQPDSGLAWAAPVAARAALMSGQAERARAWRDQLLAAPGGGAAAATLAPLLAIAGVAEPPSPAELLAWLEASGETANPRDAERRLLLLLLAEAFGWELPEAAWRPFLTDGGSSPGAALPVPLGRGLTAASERGRLGETVLLGLIGLGAAGAEAPPPALAEVVAAFRRAGLEREARQLAVEALIERGA